jgi:zinc and cadmium transporter
VVNELRWIIVGGLLMSVIALVGGLTTVLRRSTLERILLPLVALAAGTLMGGAFFHMIPEGGAVLTPTVGAAWLLAGFTAFLVLEQFLSWHHSHREGGEGKRPVGYLILIGDGVHNFLGGVGVASTFLISPRAGIIAWMAAAAHEIPQELGDFAILVHGGWKRHHALLWNFLSALTFPVGALLAYVAAPAISLGGLVMFAAGNFIYIAASDLIPEIKAERSSGPALVHLGCFVGGVVLMFLLARVFHG